MVSAAHALIGQRVRITGLSSRPALNGKQGVAESFNAQTGRYNVFLDGGELVALLPARVEPVRGGAPGARGGGAGGGVGAGGIADRARAAWATAERALRDARLPGNIEPHHVAAGLTAGLVLILGWSLVNAGLVGLLLMAVLRGARRPGGLGGAARDVGLSAAALLQRVTGQLVTPAQAWFLLAAVVGMAYYFWLQPGQATASGRISSPGAGAATGRTNGGGGYGGFAFFGGAHEGSGLFGSLSSLDLGYMLSVGVLGTFAWNLGGGGTPVGWRWGELVRQVQGMNLWQLLMLSNLLQQVLGGGGGRRGYGGMGYGRRRMFY
jgi:hypothetical protein